MRSGRGFSSSLGRTDAEVAPAEPLLLVFWSGPQKDNMLEREEGNVEC